MTVDDMTLLQEYASNNSEQAFTALVQRHINLVYSVALRQLQDPSLAEEVTQVVFIILARKAQALSPNTILPGWLCRTARYASANALTAQRRRERREQEAHMQSALNESETEAWNQIAPLLDDALARLGGKDHDAIVLRFFENKSLNEVGVAIGTSPDTARMRINRAVAKLRKFFMRRGITLSTALIAAAVSANSVQAAPATLSIVVKTTAIAKGTAASASTLALMKGVLKIMAWTNAKIAMAATAAVLLAASTTTVVIKEIHNRRPATVVAAKAGTAQIYIKSTFFEVPEEIALPLSAQLFSKAADSNSISSAILTQSQAQSVSAKLKAQKGVNLITSPSVITLSGRQAQVQVVDVQTIVTGFKPESLSPPGIKTDANNSGVYQINTNFLTGPVLDIVPRIRADRHTIDLTVAARVNEFHGYAEPTNQVTVYIDGVSQSLPQQLPQIRIRQLKGQFQIQDAQTLVLGNPLDADGKPAESTGMANKYLFVFVTPTIVTPSGKLAGNPYPGDWIWKLDPRSLDRVPPLLIIQPSKRPAAAAPVEFMKKDRFLVEGITIKGLIARVYSQKDSQLKLTYLAPLPEGKFDCIAVTAPDGKWWNVLQAEINKRFNLVEEPGEPGTVVVKNAR